MATAIAASISPSALLACAAARLISNSAWMISVGMRSRPIAKKLEGALRLRSPEVQRSMHVLGENDSPTVRFDHVGDRAGRVPRQMECLKRSLAKKKTLAVGEPDIDRAGCEMLAEVDEVDRRIVAVRQARPADLADFRGNRQNPRSHP
jgi:hypothetical protein